MKLPFYSVAVIAMCFLLACGRNSNNLKEIADSSPGMAEGEVKTQDIELAEPPEQKREEKGKFSTVSADTAGLGNNLPDPSILNNGNNLANEDWDKKIIKTARITLELKDFATFNTTLHDKLKRYGAYVSGEQQTESDLRIQNTLTIKVPVVQFEDLMNSIGGNGIQVLEKSISTEDVTGEVVDTKARIAAKQQVRDKYVELLKQAKTMKDILAVQEEINGIQEDLEAASGRMLYLSHSSAYSTIHLTYYQYINGNSANTAEPSFLTKVKEAFATGGVIITNIILFFVSVWPIVLAAVVLFLYVKRGKLKKV